MKAVNFWKTLLCSVMAVAAFTACSDDGDDNGYTGMPEITVNGADAITVAAKLAGGTAEPAVEVVSKGDWDLTFENENDKTWCTPSVLSGKTGTTKLTFTLGQAAAPRQATIKLIARSTFEGIPLTQTATIVVKQNEGGSTAVETNVAEIRALLKAMNPEQTKKDVTAEIAAKSITGIICSDYEGGNMGSTVYVAVQDCEIAPNSGLILVSSKFTDLKLPAGTVVTASLANAQVGTYGEVIQLSLDNATTIEHTAGTAPQPYVVTVDKLLDYESMLVKIETCQPIESIVGKKWTDVFNTGTMEVENGGDTFNITTAKSATFKENVIPDNSGYVQGIASQWLGAPQLRPRNAADIVLDQPRFEVKVDYTKVTINQITEAGDYEIDAAIVGVHSKGVMFADNAGGKNNYILAFNNDWKTQDANPYKNDVNKSAVAKGAVKDQYGLWQFNAPEITVGSAVSFNLGTPATFDAAAIQAYASAIKADQNASEYKYVALSGTLTIENKTSYNSYTLAVEGLSDELVKTVTLAYAFDSYYTGIASGDVVDVKGFALGFDTSKGNLNILVTQVAKNTTTPSVQITTTPKTFAAAGDAEGQVIEFKVANKGNNKVFAKIEGTDAAQFSVPAGEITGTSVKVTAKENTANTSKTAKLVIYLAASEGGAVVESDEVSLMQAPAGASKQYTEIKSVAELTEGEYLIGGYGTKEKVLCLYTSGLTNGSGYTSKYTYDATTGSLATEATYPAVTIKLEAVAGVANAYKIKDTKANKYLIATAAGSGKLELQDAADSYWILSDAGNADKVVAQDIKAELSGDTPNIGLVISISAGSNVLRSWNLDGSSKANGLVFFKKNF